MDWILDPLQYPFMQRALLAAVLVGLICPLVGGYVVVRGLAFFGDALAHSVFPGVVIAYLLGISLLLGGLAAGVLVAVAIGLVARRTTLDHQTSIGVVFPVAFAVGVLLLAGVPTFATDLTHILFGNLLGVTAFDLAVTGTVAAVVVAFVAGRHRPLGMATFDPVAARLAGVPVAALDLALLVVLALVVVVAVQTAGTLLVLSLLVTPAAAAWLLVRSMRALLLLAASIGVVSAVLGAYASWYLAVPPGPAVVLAAAATFAMLAAARALWRWVRQLLPESLVGDAPVTDL